MIQNSTMLKLGRAAGEACATGAVQRLEQSIANVEQKNDTTEEGVAIFRKAMMKTFIDVIGQRVIVDERAETAA